MRRAAAILLVLLLPLPALAAGLVTTEPAVLYDAPSQKAKPVLILSGGFPLRQISMVTGWRKVAGYSGETGWVREKVLKDGDFAVVVAGRTAGRTEAHAASAAVFFATRGVVLEVLGSSRAGWLRVVHRDGEVAHLLETDTWINFR